MKTQNITPQIILGSSSIYRKELLQRLQIPFETEHPDVNETPLYGESPEETAMRLAEAKARAVAKTYPHALIIGSDQVAALGNIPLGKPLSHENAVKQLQLVRGKEVVFYTALCLLNSAADRLQSRVIPYHVKFRPLSDQQIENYLCKEQPYHCAGSAKSEGLGIALIERMTGDDPNGLIGLPMIALVDMLMAEDVEIF
ncbi:Maf family protein [Nitrosomonas oligotropha]|uniref:7-methyl-GTP pyrophosphatase n=1 Tax=Nitrosomonas oligotropha TaxID=42354 RepID=A0A1H8M0M4_9PROT|nr:Maf family nucleotide pyrophosphatase [Nitrosomonas oligotropha]SDW37060.1 septum formation protein [Nitrosomonas oligotropha]SEO10913.1 septum formation protein [Nitrosomonas oligotropha]